jgi:hypothetical protein
MLATSANEATAAAAVAAANHTPLIDDDRYFQCEPMDATVSPIALTNHGSHSVADNSNQGSSNPGTPAPN